MRHYAYHFAAKGIQRYVLAGGRLIDIAGASELLASTIRSDNQDLLAKTLIKAGLDIHKTPFSRRAGGAFLMHYTEDQQQGFDRFRALWRLAFSLHAPGLEFAETITCGSSQKEVEDLAYKIGTDQRDNGPATLLPINGPLVSRSPRTALAAIGMDYDEAVDVPTLRKRTIARDDFRGFTNRFLPDGGAPSNIVWPTQLDEDDALSDYRVSFPFCGDDRRIGVIHADISGLGQLFRQHCKEGQVQSFDLAKKIEESILAAAKNATKAILCPNLVGNVLPARPILLGGDDLTIIVRADLAIPYAEYFLKALEDESTSALSCFGIKQPLTACAGIAIITAHQPFYQALDLAESLCSYAKKQVKAGMGREATIPSAIAFHTVLSSLIGDDYDTIRRVEFQCKARSGSALTAQPYLVGHHTKDGLFHLDSLKKLKDAMNRPELATGRLRDLQRLLLTEPANSILFKTAWGNWQKIAKARNEVAFSAFKSEMACFGVQIENLELNRGFFSGDNTPLFDALSWQRLERLSTAVLS